MRPAADEAHDRRTPPPARRQRESRKPRVFPDLLLSDRVVSGCATPVKSWLALDQPETPPRAACSRPCHPELSATAFELQHRPRPPRLRRPPCCCCKTRIGIAARPGDHPAVGPPACRRSSSSRCRTRLTSVETPRAEAGDGSPSSRPKTITILGHETPRRRAGRPICAVQSVTPANAWPGCTCGTAGGVPAFAVRPRFLATCRFRSGVSEPVPVAPPRFAVPGMTDVPEPLPHPSAQGDPRPGPTAWSTCTPLCPSCTSPGAVLVRPCGRPIRPKPRSPVAPSSLSLASIRLPLSRRFPSYFASAKPLRCSTRARRRSNQPPWAGCHTRGNKSAPGAHPHAQPTRSRLASLS